MRCREREEDWRFEFLKSRINTRENSTLMFSTVTVSVSLIVLSLIIGQENLISTYLLSIYLSISQQSNLHPIILLSHLIYHNWQTVRTTLYIVGIITISSGILYREITIFLTDREDHRFLERCRISHFRYFRIPRPSAKATVPRSFLVRLFFFASLAMWLCNWIMPPIISFQPVGLYPACIYPACIFAFVTIFLPALLTICEFSLRDRGTVNLRPVLEDFFNF